MSYLCFGTFFSLICGNKKDWDKKRKPTVSNRVLYFALLDIIDQQKNSNHYTQKATSGDNPGYKDDVVSSAKNCCRIDHPIQRTGSVDNYRKRFMHQYESVVTDYQAYIQKYLDEQQLNRLTRSIIELINNSQVSEAERFYIGDTLQDHCTKKKLVQEKEKINLPCFLAGVMYYIIDNEIPNDSIEAKNTILEWKRIYKNMPYCPDGSSVGREIQVTCDIFPKENETLVKDTDHTVENQENCAISLNEDTSFNQEKTECDKFMAKRIKVTGNEQVVFGDVIEENATKIIVNGNIDTLNL